MPKHTTPEQVTDILREFLDSGQDMTEFAKNKKMERNTLANWVKGIKVPGGRQGLTDEERGKLDERVRKTDPQKVTELLREFLGSGQNMTEFAKNKEMGRTTFFEWVKGIKVAGGRQGLTDEERGKLDERVRKTDPQKVTEVLREFLESNLIGSEFARSKKIGPSVFYNWVKGVKVPDGRAGLTPAERELLDGRFQENRWDKEGPQKVTRILREFLESDLSGSEFARNKKIERSVFYRWVGGKRVPGGRAGLTPAERGLLDGRLRENRWNQADPQNVTQTLREFLDSDLNMAEFSKIKDISPTTFYNWVSGKKVAGGRAGLTQAEQERLDERRRGNLRRGPGLEQGVAGTGVGAAVEEMPQAVAWSPAAAVLPQQSWESHAQPSLPQYAAASSPLALEGPAGAAGALGSRTFAAAAADRPALSGLSSFGANGRMLPPPFPSSAVSSDYLHSPGTPAPVSGNSNRRLPPLPNRDPQKDPFFGSGGSQGQARGGR